MEESFNRAQIDLAVMRAMVDEMSGYLHREVVYGTMPSNMPRLTLGGYLMRQHRLQAMAPMLADELYQGLQKVTERFDAIMADNVVHAEAKAHQELAARLTQWSNYLAEVERDPEEYGFEYRTAVQNRVIIAELLKFLAIPPYELNEDLQEQTHKLDEYLKEMWVDGRFIWPNSWAVAYPKSVYWWMYGQPVEQVEEDEEEPLLEAAG